MFFFKKKSPKTVDLSWLGADMHSHLVPGIDDGSPDLETSLSLIRGFADLGYQKIITTPHVLWDMYPNTTATIREGCATVQDALKQEGIGIEFRAAAEYFIDDHFKEVLERKEPLLTLKDNLVLVEFSMVTAPMDLQEVLFELQMQNYQPVIAHPERYIYLARNKAFFETLKDAGNLFQLNLLSLTGHYGNSVQELAEYLAKKDFYSFAGTDLHGARHLEGLQKLSGSATLARLQESGLLKNRNL
jgi:tyrosine-protein phosphatase YwqE